MHDPLIQRVIDAFTCLPGVGAKTAQRMTYHLLERERVGAQSIVDHLQQALNNIQHCQQCRTLSSQELCGICADSRRDMSTVCVVETPADVLSIEQSGVFKGRYFVLLGRLSPLDGMGPNEIGIHVLQAQLASGKIEELILATGATVEGEATAHFIADLAKASGVKTSRIAQGVPMGGDLEYVDAATLTHAFSGRHEL